MLHAGVERGCPGYHNILRKSMDPTTSYRSLFNRASKTDICLLPIHPTLWSSTHVTTKRNHGTVLKRLVGHFSMEPPFSSFRYMRNCIFPLTNREPQTLCHHEQIRTADSLTSRTDANHTLKLISADSRAQYDTRSNARPPCRAISAKTASSASQPRPRRHHSPLFHAPTTTGEQIALPGP